MNIRMNLDENSYDIIIKRGILADAGKHLDLNRKVFIVTDDKVPSVYAETVANQCLDSTIAVVESGEGSKSIEVYECLLSQMLSNGFDRGDCVVAVGGGVVGDLSGFVASSYMRGIDFYNIPTTLLSQIDSSIGGKVAVNLDGVKNIIGAFYQPKKVLIDPDVLKTLDKRQISNGLSEAVKMALTSDKELFELFEKGDVLSLIDTIIEKSLMIKKSVVEKDEKENGLRKVLNFGHTIGHAIEVQRKDLYHGECVALGMIPMISQGIRERLIKVLQKLSLPTNADFNTDEALETLSHDKKTKNGQVTVICVDEVGTFSFKEVTHESLKSDFEIIKRS